MSQLKPSGIKIFDGTDTVNRAALNENFQTVDTKLDATAGHKHTGAAGDAPQIDSAGIKDNAVTAAKILDGAVGTAELASGAVTAAKIANGTITATQIATGAVGAAQIADLGVGTAELADKSVTTAKIADSAIGALQIADGTVGTVEIANLAVTAAKIANATITATQIANATITSTQLATGSVGAAQITDGSVGTAELASLAVTGAKMANNTITGTQIANGAIGATQIANGAVGAAQIADGGVGTAEIADSAITTAKLANKPMMGFPNLIDPKKFISTRNTSAFTHEGEEILAYQIRSKQGKYGSAPWLENGTYNILNGEMSNLGTLNSSAGVMGVHSNRAAASINLKESWQGSGCAQVVVTGILAGEDVNFTINGEGSNGIISKASTTYAFSVYAKIPKGKQVAIRVIDFATDGLSVRSDDNVWFTGTGSWQRLTRTYTTVSTAGKLTFRIRFDSDGTYLLDAAQVEEKAYATSWIPGNLSRPTDRVVQTIPALPDRIFGALAWKPDFDSDKPGGEANTMLWIDTEETFQYRYLLQWVGNYTQNAAADRYRFNFAKYYSGTDAASGFASAASDQNSLYFKAGDEIFLAFLDDPTAGVLKLWVGINGGALKEFSVSNTNKFPANEGNLNFCLGSRSAPWYDSIYNANGAVDYPLVTGVIPTSEGVEALYRAGDLGGSRHFPIVHNALRASVDTIRIFVDPTNGNDENPGTDARPFRSIQGAVNSLPKILNHEAYILLKAGTYDMGTIGNTYIAGFVGNGVILIEGLGGDSNRGAVYIQGELLIERNTVFTRVYNLTLKPYAAGVTVRAAYAEVFKCDINGTGFINADTRLGVGASGYGSLTVYDCYFTTFTTASYWNRGCIAATSTGQIMAFNNSFNSCDLAYFADYGHISATGSTYTSVTTQTQTRYGGTITS